MKPKMIVFLDTIGRTIIGEVITQDESFVTVKNPAVVACEADRTNGRISLQLFPVFFKEFQADRSAPTLWKYSVKNMSAVADGFELDFRFEGQYQALFAPVAEQPVIKLFNDEEVK